MGSEPRPTPKGIRRHRILDFFGDLLRKGQEDDIFFMAGAIAFNVLVAFVPLLLFAVGISASVLSARVGDPSGMLLDLLQRGLPAIRGEIDLVAGVRSQIEGLLERRTGFTVVGAALLVWFSTRLVGTLRIALREIFDIGRDRGIVGGKFFDIQMVLAGSVLVLLNLGLTALVGAAERFGIDALGLGPDATGLVQVVVAQMVAFLSIWVLFLVVYRYLPARRIPWRPAIIAATFTALLHELLKEGFGWYVTDVANYRTTYGNLITVAILFFWIYYEAIGFILGGEVAQVWTMRRARRTRMRATVFGGNGGDR